jgi:hypothetical protein
VHDVGEVQARAVAGLAASVAAVVQVFAAHWATTVGLGGVPEPATDSTVQVEADEHEIVPGSVGTPPAG